jgi:hypothetical protein
MPWQWPHLRGPGPRTKPLAHVVRRAGWPDRPFCNSTGPLPGTRGVPAACQSCARRSRRRLLQNPLHAHVARASCPCFMGGTPMPRGVLQEPRRVSASPRPRALRTGGMRAAPTCLLPLPPPCWAAAPVPCLLPLLPPGGERAAQRFYPLNCEPLCGRNNCLLPLPTATAAAPVACGCRHRRPKRLPPRIVLVNPLPVCAAAHAVDPFAVVEIPADGLVEAGLEGLGRMPA